MKRLLSISQQEHYDLMVVGGGIYGAAMAYTASLNGLKTVLLERQDFCSGSSAHSQKVIHGGLRYLQTLDLKRVLVSIREKQRFYYLFPHLVKPLPCILPTSGRGTSGNEAFRLAFLLYKIIEKVVCRGSLARNLTTRSRIISKDQVTQHFPHLRQDAIRGGALWYDGLCVEPERVIIGLLKAAVQRGLQVSNYTEVTSISRLDEKTLTAMLFDHESQKKFQITSTKVALCTGAWFKDDLGPGPIPEEIETLTLIRGMNVILPSLFTSNASFATKVITNEKSRFLFVVPWKQYSICGTHWEQCPDDCLNWSDKNNMKKSFHALLKQSVYGGEKFPEICSEHVGCVPGTHETKIGQSAAEQILAHYKIIDREVSRRGDVLQVVGVKFTTAFDVVLRVLQKLFPSRTIKDVLRFNTLPYGSPAGDIELLMSLYEYRYKEILHASQIKTVFDHFGDELPRIIEHYLRPLHDGETQLTELQLYSGLTAHCVEEEMALHLDDLIYRRLFPDTPQLPPPELLDSLAECMAKLLSWPAQVKAAELERVLIQRKAGL